MSDLSSEEISNDPSTTGNAARSLSVAARDFEAKERGKRAQYLNLYATVLQVVKEKYYV